MKLSGKQIFWLMFSFQFGDKMFIINSPTIEYAKQDAWIAHTIASLLGILLIYIAVKVGQDSPEDTFVALTKKTLGKFLGTAFVFLYLIVWITVLPIILIEVANFLNTI